RDVGDREDEVVEAVDPHGPTIAHPPVGPAP
ncbi:MAG: hypothetical protein QOC64_846, partial [Solirubrobacteraceae bacterium]|nr:hypothetical protein [Solirubrobacteraceae bacterium]